MIMWVLLSLAFILATMSLKEKSIMSLCFERNKNSLSHFFFVLSILCSINHNLVHTHLTFFIKKLKFLKNKNQIHNILWLMKYKVKYKNYFIIFPYIVRILLACNSHSSLCSFPYCTIIFLFLVERTIIFQELTYHCICFVLHLSHIISPLFISVDHVPTCPMHHKLTW